MFIQANACPIWGPGEGRATQHGLDIYVYEAHRAGGQYVIHYITQQMLLMDDSQKARLTTMLVNEREQGETWPMVTTERIEEAKKADPLSPPERAERLLRYLVKCSAGKIGSKIPIRARYTPEYRGALAWSESTDLDDIVGLSDYLSKNGWVEIVVIPNTFDSYAAIVTVDGYTQIESLKTNLDSAQAFVAMWFDDETNDAYEKGIKPAIEQSGFQPMRIDHKPDANKLDEEIIEEIHRSRFLVSDMTHGEDGARGSVYFEAGFAMGLNIPIIYTCRSDLMSEVQFDIRQYAHIVWKKGEEAELQDRLLQRILARIGEGPNMA